MDKKIKTTNTAMEVTTNVANIVRIDDFKFVKEDLHPWVDVYVIGIEEDRFISEEDGEEVVGIVDLEDLKRFAINWFGRNVEVVKEETK